MSSRDFTGSNVKKSSSHKSNRVWRLFFQALGRFTSVRARTLAIVVAAPVAALVIWPDPGRTERIRRETDAAIAREAADNAPPAVVDGVAEMSFRWLAFQPSINGSAPGSGEPSYGSQVPERIKQFDRSQVRIRGYMLPVRIEGTRVRDFMILPSPTTCCYGRSPRFCEFINASIRGVPIAPKTDEPVTFEGILHVGDVYVNGYWSALYTLDCSRVDP
jgi:hypothetical protein